jgi:hypothetical protein
MRTESTPGYTSVLDFDHRRQVNWRTDLRQYAVQQWPPDHHNDLATYERVGRLPNNLPQYRRDVPRTWSELLQACGKMIEDWLSSLFGSWTNR